MMKNITQKTVLSKNLSYFFAEGQDLEAPLLCNNTTTKIMVTLLRYIVEKNLATFSNISF